MAEHNTDTEAPDLLSELIQIDTSNRGDGDCSERPAAEYVFAKLDEVDIESTILESAPGRANVVARISGSESDRDALLVHGHLDVVPAEASDWSVDPFSGEIHDGYIWGRGAIDMKNMDAMILTVVRSWARQGLRPQRDIVLAFTADEEDSAVYGSEFLVREHADLFQGCTEGISEGGGYTFHAAEGVRLYPIAAGERGTAWLELTARGTTGHGSRVNDDNAVGALASAVARIDSYQWPMRLAPTVRAALVSMGAALGIEVDPEAPDFDVEAVLDKLGPARKLVESTVRNSANPTMLDAGYKVNVIPGTAKARIDGRTVPGASDEFEATMDALTGERVEWRYHHQQMPMTAPIDSPTFAKMAAAVEKYDPDAHVVPYCMAGGTDAKQFSELGITGYGFVPMLLPADYDITPLIHGIDERVPVDALHFGVAVLNDFLLTA